MAIPTSELQKINPSSLIELFELTLTESLHGADQTYRFHNGSSDVGTQDIIWDGNTYTKYPIQVEGFEYNAESSSLPRPTLTISNVFGAITTLILAANNKTPGNDLTGAKLVRIRTLVRYIDAANFEDDTNPYGTPDTTATLPTETYYLARKVVENRDTAQFEAAASFDLATVKAPKRQCNQNLCPWIYKGAECGYSGTNYFDENDNSTIIAADDKCGKRLSSCQIRFGTNAELPFGGFPSIGLFGA